RLSALEEYGRSSAKREAGLANQPAIWLRPASARPPRAHAQTTLIAGPSTPVDGVALRDRACAYGIRDRTDRSLPTDKRPGALLRLRQRISSGTGKGGSAGTWFDP